ncbi:MAG: glycine cleavage system aminomethyltransferase GcvT [Thermoanaerobaculum sp.]|nr:glycine cleavage system aminomethyltransferase GcvT [Thermoanaerobaculum sp.]MDW7966595.1 glycine cleavage system aminomethyltransferase GcvT [Thermoanaerobaculum sp.]
MSSAPAKRTPLYPVHVASGAKMVHFAGWEMPVQYRGVLEEHRAVRTRVGLFDVSHMGELEVVGRRALDFVQYVTCNDASRLVPGRAQYSGLMTPRGTFVDDLLVHMVSPERFLLVVNAANKDKDYAYLCAQAPAFDQVEVYDRSAEYAQLAIQGPLAEAVLQKLTSVTLSEIKYYRFVEGDVAAVRGIIARTGYTGEDGFEVYLPAAKAAEVWQALMQAGAEHGIQPCGLGARDTLRFEACMPLYGQDIDDTTTPFEAGLDWIVKLEKGPFLGREALIQQRNAGIKRKLVGFAMLGKGIPRHGYPLLHGSEEVGVVTSGTMSPTLGKALGLGYLPVALATPGTEVWVDIRGQRVPAQVVEIPFYRRKK